MGVGVVVGIGGVGVGCGELDVLIICFLCDMIIGVLCYRFVMFFCCVCL